MPTLHLSQQQALAFAAKPTSALSILCSAAIAIFILVSKARRGNAYHRISLAISVHIILQTSALFVGPAAIPADVQPSIYGAAGTIATCNIQGFVNFSARFALGLYYCSLPILIVAQLQAKHNEHGYANTRFLERYIHLTCNLVPLIFSIIAIQRKYFNPMPGGGFCELNVFPHGCLHDPSGAACIRGDAGFLIVFHLSVIIRLISTTVLLWAIRKIYRIAVHSMKQSVPIGPVLYPILAHIIIGLFSYYTATMHKGSTFSFKCSLFVLILWPCIGILHLFVYLSLRPCSWMMETLPPQSSTEHNSEDVESQHITITPPEVISEVNLQLQWTHLENVKYIASGGNCWIYSIDFNKRSAVIKVLKPEYQSSVIATNEMEDELGTNV